MEIIFSTKNLKPPSKMFFFGKRFRNIHEIFAGKYQQTIFKKIQGTNEIDGSIYPPLQNKIHVNVLMLFELLL